MHVFDITMEHAQAAANLAGVHRDPFDRLPAAQAIAERLTLLSNDTAIDGPGASRIW